MRLKLLMTGMVLVLAALAMAQTMDEPPEAYADDSDRPLAGQAELTALAPPPLQLGADLGNACVCLCRQAAPPRGERWGHYERSIVAGCQWTGRVCLVEGELGKIGACTESPAPLG
jgi:hypothetical protein